MNSQQEAPTIPTSIWALGFVSCLMKISSIIIYILSPLFITQILGVSVFVVGLLESFVETITLFSRLFAGILSDIIHKRKSIIAVGYVFAFISRPILALSTHISGVFLGRAFDRVGNGLDATPRDALVGDLSPKEIKGACYGLRESLSRFGAFTGAVIAVGLLWITGNNYPLVFWIGSIPTLLALFVLLRFVKDPVSEKFQNKKHIKKFKLENVYHLPLPFWLVLLMSGIFMISNFSGAFLILRTADSGIDTYLVPLVMVVQNIATTLTAYPVGYLSDKVGRRSMMAVGIFLLIASNFFLATGESIYFVLSGVFLWGAQIGIAQSILAVLVADSCPEDLRGTGFGLLQSTNQVGLIIANSLSGWVWTQAGPTTMFMMSACIAFAASFVLPFIHKTKT